MTEPAEIRSNQVIESAAIRSKELATAIADRRQKRLDPEEFLNYVIEYFGGVKEFAQRLHAEFEAAPAGGMARQRILEMINRAFLSIWTAKGPGPSAEDLSTEELVNVLRTALEKPGEK